MNSPCHELALAVLEADDAGGDAMSIAIAIARKQVPHQTLFSALAALTVATAHATGNSPREVIDQLFRSAPGSGILETLDDHMTDLDTEG